MTSPCAQGHEWDGCICWRCGATREHIFSAADECTCKRCGETRHELEACVCTRCGAAQHDPDDKCRCRRCGELAHDWGAFWDQGVKKQTSLCQRCGFSTDRHAR